MFFFFFENKLSNDKRYVTVKVNGTNFCLILVSEIHENKRSIIRCVYYLIKLSPLKGKREHYSSLSVFCLERFIIYLAKQRKWNYVDVGPIACYILQTVPSSKCVPFVERCNIKTTNTTINDCWIMTLMSRETKFGELDLGR